MLAKILAWRLEPLAENTVGEYHCGFRKKRATTDQDFLIRQILEKCHEYQIKLHHLFVNYKQAYDSLKRQSIIEIMEEFSMPGKLVSRIKMTLEGTWSKVRVEGELTEEFDVQREL